MKRNLTIIVMLFCCLAISAQNDVTTFLGIPVDGYKTDMKKKLISKGFTSNKYSQNQDCLEGEFNGTDVNVFIVTNNNKVFRIMLCDANTQNEASIKIRFNRLVSQFEKNNRYLSFNSYTISEEEDISYEMSVNNKIYEAIFYQVPDHEKLDTVAIHNQARQELLKQFTEEQLNNPTEEVKQEIQLANLSIVMDLISKKPVWFRIMEAFGKYYIAMYYDNEYNHANGEDL